MPVLCSVIGLRLKCNVIDVLHTVDQGVASHDIANNMWVLVKRKAWGALKDEDTSARLLCFTDMHNYYRDARETHRVQGELNVERVRTSGG